MKKIFVTGIIIFITFSSFRLIIQPNIKPSVARGKKVYESTCLACHQSDGDGVPRMNPTLIKTKWVLGNKSALIKIVLSGLKGGEIEIDGDNFHNPMPPHATLLTDQQIADVLTYVRSNFGNKASAVLPAEVKTVRASIKSASVKQAKKASSK